MSYVSAHEVGKTAEQIQRNKKEGNDEGKSRN